MSAPEDFELQLLAGLPVSSEGQRQLGLASAVPPPNSTQFSCHQCRQAIWLGPRQQAMLRASAMAKPTCFLCAAIMQKSISEVGPFPVKHLDGESGEYTTTSGEIFPPKDN